MEYVLDENGNIKIGPNGKPMAKDGDKEFEIDAIGAQAKMNDIIKTRDEAKKKLGVATVKLEAFGDLDPEASRKALEDVASIGDKNKIDMDAQRDSINETWKAKEGTWNTEKDALTGKLFDATVGVNFANSKVIKKTVLPPDIAKATFGKHFNPDGTANDAAGNLINSASNPGYPADFDEAMEKILDAYPGKKDIMKASEANGGGGHNAGNGDGGTVVKSAQTNIAEGLKAL